MGNCLTVSHMCLPCLPSSWDGPFVLGTLMIGLSGGSVDVFLCMVSTVLVS